MTDKREALRLRNDTPLHPFLAGVAPVLMLFSHNIREAEFRELVLPLLAVMVATAISLLVGQFLLHGVHKAAIFVSAAWFAFFSYGHILSVLRNIWPDRYLQIGVMLFGVYCLAGVSLLLLLWKMRIPVRGVTRFLNAATVALVLVPIATAVSHQLRTMRDRRLSPAVSLAVLDTTSQGPAHPLPDIYYILLDRHANSRVLHQVFHHDNGAFLAGLRLRGFYVAAAATSNYARTHLSLAATLNLDYINSTVELVSAEYHQRLLRNRLEDNLVRRFLATKGYVFYHFGTGWGPTSRNRHADRDFNSGILTDFAMLLYRTSMAYPVGSKLGFDVRTEQYRRVLSKFAQLARVPESGEPVFAFAHFVLPHEPYVFSPTGGFVSRSEQDRAGVMRGYLSQLEFADRRVVALVDTILATSETPPVIVIQADEGPHPRDCFPPVDSLTDLRAKFGILNAMLLPGADSTVLYPSISPVNTWRVVFNAYFGTNLPLLPDRNYVLDQDRYQFVDVTETVRWPGQ